MAARSRQCAGRGLIPCAISGCAPICRPRCLEKLARADAFRSLGLDRRDALWAVRALQRSGDKDDLPLLARVHMHELEPDVALPPMRPGEHVIEDYRTLHLSLKAHPLVVRAARARRHAEFCGTNNCRRLLSGRIVTVAGLVLVRQRPGDAKAIFMTLEDETGIANTIVWLRAFEALSADRARRAAHQRDRRIAERAGRHPHHRRIRSRICRPYCAP